MHTHPSAALWRRLICMLYEALLLIGVLAISVVLPLALLMAWGGLVLPPPLQVTYIFLVLGAYFVWHWGQGRQTLAMKTWKIKLAGFTDAPPHQNQLLLRYVLSWPSLLLFGAGLLWALFDRDRQFLHDRLAGTRLVSVAPPTTASNPPPVEK